MQATSSPKTHFTSYQYKFSSPYQEEEEEESISKYSPQVMVSQQMPLYFNPIYSLFHTCAVGDVKHQSLKDIRRITSEPLIKLSTDTSIESAMLSLCGTDECLKNIPKEKQKTLGTQKQNICTSCSSAPLYDRQKKFLGMLSVKQIVRFMWQICSNKSDKQRQKLDASWFKNYTLQDVIDTPFTQFGASGKDDPAINILHSDQLSKACRILEKTLPSCALPIRDSLANIYSVISSSDIIKYLYNVISKHEERYEFLHKIQVNSQDYEEAISIDANATIAHCLDVLIRTDAESLAIVSTSTKRIIGNVSFVDFGGIFIDYQLYGKKHKIIPENETIVEFLERHHPNSLYPSVIHEIPPVSLYDVIKIMAETGFHHIYFVDQDYNVKRLITQHDLLTELRLLKVDYPDVINVSKRFNKLGFGAIRKKSPADRFRTVVSQVVVSSKQDEPIEQQQQQQQEEEEEESTYIPIFFSPFATQL